MNTAEQYRVNQSDAHLLADLESARIRLAPGLHDVVPVASLLQLQVEARRAHYGALLFVGLSSNNAACREARAQALVEALRAMGCEVPVLRYDLDRSILDEALGRTKS